MHSKFYKPKFWKFFPSKIKSANADNYIDICKCTPKLRNSSKVLEKRKYRVQMQLIIVIDQGVRLQLTQFSFSITFLILEQFDSILQIDFENYFYIY